MYIPGQCQSSTDKATSAELEKKVFSSLTWKSILTHCQHCNKKVIAKQDYSHVGFRPCFTFTLNQRLVSPV